MNKEMTDITGEQLHEMQEYLRNHMDDYSLRDMADCFAMSQSRLQSYFMDEYGMSIYTYMRTLCEDAK